MATGQQRWIWPFELQEKLGEGGMGVVYRARYVVKNWPVAVKLLPDHIASNATMVARFERELEVLRKLRHPHIVHCFGGTCESKQRFYAMELVEGGTLDRLLQEKGRLSWEQTIEYAQQICAALAYAHDRGVIHRDIKPGNFLITPDGKLKLSDFGLATVMAGNRLTAAGKTLGTFHYMAPEQIRGKPPVSPKTDLYALGCVIFEMLTGHPPFDGETPAEVLHLHLKEKPPRVVAEVPDCPAKLDQLVTELLEKDPERRPASAHDVLERLRDVSPLVVVDPTLMTRTVVAPTITPSDSAPVVPKTTVAARRQALSWVGWGVAAMLLVVCFVLWQRGAPDSHAARLWLAAAGHEEPSVRIAAAEALGELGRDLPDAVEQLQTGLSDANPRVRTAAAEALGELGSAARPAINQLLRTQQQDDSPPVRYAAEAALKKIKSAESSSSLWPWLIGLLLLAGGAVGVYFWKKSSE